MNQQPEAVENYIQQAITTERREWNKLTRELYAQIDTLNDQLTTATRQKDEAIDTLATTQEARYNAEATYTEAISDRNAEIERLEKELINAREFCEDLHQENLQLKEERDIFQKALNLSAESWGELYQAIKAIKAITAKIYTE